MSEVYNELARVGVAGFGASAAAGGGAADRLLIDSERLPTGPIKRIAQQVASGAKGAAMGGMRSQINAQWQAQVAPLCRQALANRYPFAQNASADVALADFARLFAPNGMIDGFFNKHLIGFVDASSKPWRWNKQAASLGISSAVLAQFQRAAAIRDSFFLAGAMPTVTFTVSPTMLDASASSVILEVEGQQLTYAHGPVQPAAMKWPGTPGGRTRIAFQPGQAGAENSIQTQGPWSFFRLLDRARVSRARSDAFTATFSIGGRSASFAVQAGSVMNPFSLPALRGFSCPSSM
jgi:type VI secretion system protein ImpL